MVYGEFNGIRLDSDTVTMDGAYVAVTGKTKAEFDKYQQDQIDDYKRRKQEHEDRIPELTELWVEKGKEVLAEDKWELWEKIVPIRLGDLYKGMELGNCLDIVTILNTGNFEEAKKLIENQGHSGMSFGLVCSMVKEFSDKGSEFVDLVR